MTQHLVGGVGVVGFGGATEPVAPRAGRAGLIGTPVALDWESIESKSVEGEEDETVVLTAEGDVASTDPGEDVVYDLAVAAASVGKSFDGPSLAALLREGPAIDDVRLTIAVEVLALGQKLSGDKLLEVLERLGFTAEVAAARVAKEELAKEPDVAVIASSPVPVTEGEDQ